MKKELAIVTLIVLSVMAVIYSNEEKNVGTSFEDWKKTFEVTFSENEELYRRFIFERNLQTIQKHNADTAKTYKMAVNQFTVYSEEEFKARFLGQVSSSKEYTKVFDGQNVPNIEIDWTTKGAVSRVKNQGSCGSCWAFASIASCESWALLEKKTVDLSEQQLVDCSSSYGNHGCNGGARLAALKYVKDHGVSTESAYPYKAVTETCKKQGGEFKINTITEASGCTGIQNALSARPVAVAVDAGGWSHYSSGIFSNCGKNINHAVLLVGVVSGSWKIKNSWGTTWGEKGFIRLAAGDTCGVCQQPGVYPH